jgi:diaminopimelate decarboxylase
MEKTVLHSNVTVNEKGHLCFAGLDTVELAEKYGTALYLMDEDRIRDRIRLYQSAMAESFGGDSGPLYAGKAFCCRAIYRVMAEEGMRIDLVSPGELHTAASAGFPMENAYFHGNNKTDADIRFAIEKGVGTFVADNREELDAIQREAALAGLRQRVLLRVTPGIDPHMHAAIATGKVDSKFGSPIETGQASELTAYALAQPNIALEGFHCHIGSQIFDVAPFCDAADVMLRYLAEVREKLGYTAGVLNLGGGFGVRYLASDPEIDYRKTVATIASHVRATCAALDFPCPTVLMEPGRSIVADAGMTLYTVGSVKTIRGYKSYVSVDGGMPDNPRYALYQSAYTVVNASRADADPDFTATIAGRCCESGDLIQENVALKRPERGDILAVLVTGAYNYSMASNYNRIPRPPVVMIRGGEDRLIVRRETYEDLTSLDLL